MKWIATAKRIGSKMKTPISSVRFSTKGEYSTLHLTIDNAHYQAFVYGDTVVHIAGWLLFLDGFLDLTDMDMFMKRIYELSISLHNSDYRTVNNTKWHLIGAK